VLFFLAVFAAGAAAGFLNVMAGGGSLITLPILLFLGLPAATANGTNRVAILAQNLTAVASFHRRGLSDVRTGLALAAATLPGAVAGALIAIRIPDAAFRLVLAGVLVFAVVGLLRPPPGRHEATEAAPRPGATTFLALFGIGFYGGFLQAGVGFLFMLALYQLLRLDLVRVNMYKVFIVLIYTVPALGVFAVSGNVAWTTGLILAAGNAIGAVAGTHVTVRGGERPIRMVIAGALVLMAVRLIWR
jgi:uncharacterized membrane protein YfcA